MADDESRRILDRLYPLLPGDARDNWKSLPPRIAVSLPLFLSLGRRVSVNAGLQKPVPTFTTASPLTPIDTIQDLRG